MKTTPTEKGAIVPILVYSSLTSEEIRKIICLVGTMWQKNILISVIIYVSQLTLTVPPITSSFMVFSGFLSQHMNLVIKVMVAINCLVSIFFCSWITRYIFCNTFFGREVCAPISSFFRLSVWFLMQDDLWLKTTFHGRWSLREDNL